MFQPSHACQSMNGKACGVCRGTQCNEKGDCVVSRGRMTCFRWRQDATGFHMSCVMNCGRNTTRVCWGKGERDERLPPNSRQLIK